MANTTTLPHELDTDKLTLGTKRAFGGRPDDWSLEVFYNDLPLRIETPWLRNVFGLSEYHQPNGRVAYSMSFDMAKDSEAADFHKFLVDFEKWVERQLRGMGLGEGKTFFSVIRPAKNPRYNPTLRLKMKSSGDYYDCVYLEGKQRDLWPVGEEMVHHGQRVRLVIQLLPLWSAGGRFGMSWKIASCQVEAQAQFTGTGRPLQFAHGEEETHNVVEDLNSVPAVPLATPGITPPPTPQ